MAVTIVCNILEVKISVTETDFLGCVYVMKGRKLGFPYWEF